MRLYKKGKALVAAAAMGFLIFSSCKKYEPVPLDPLTEELVFDEQDVNGFYAEQYLNNLYSFLPDGFGRINGVFLDAATDDGMPSQTAHQIEILSQARQSPASGIDDVWNQSYTAIRRSNLFLSRIDVVPITDITKEWWKAEARFIRAISYFEMVKRYGAAPLLENKVLSLNDNLQIPQSTFSECVNYIVSECDAIAGKLRKEPLKDNELGRITEGAALALKARVLLYAASPLYNANNNEAAWQAAADAAKEVMDLNVYALNNSFTGLFTTRKNKEVILAFQRAKNQSLETNNAPIGFTGTTASNGLMSPTHDLAKAFGMKNGLPITDAASGFDPLQPYLNRDPRFDATFFYNESKWLNRKVETFEGGADKPGGIVVQTRTGYYLRKFLADFSSNNAYSNQDHNFIIFRYAEILLNYAEATNESGGTEAAYVQLKALRKRAGITEGGNKMFGLKENMSREEMRTAIQLERRLELAFEEHRFWDARRWKLAEEWFNGPLHGIRIESQGTGFSYNEYEAGNIFFIAPRMYHYPIPFEEILRNKALNQTNNW